MAADPPASPASPVAEALHGRRLFVTGATGFLGTALVERLLRAAPGCELVLLVRPGRKRTVAQRAQREIFRNDCFDRLRAELDDPAAFDALVARRVTVVAGDVATDGLGLDEAGRAALASCDTVIHSAATVSFDSPLDLAVEVNLLGPSRIALTLGDLGVTPHLVAVSTCYVAGNRRGAAPEIRVDESPFWIDVDHRQEVEAARRMRADAEAASRRPDDLVRLRSEARDELGAAGTPLLAEKTEQRRHAWVKDQLVEAGRARAASLGWPDAYAMTKALGEKALGQSRGDVPVSIVRPAIIESAWSEPMPGWIRGFRMAEPVIVSYARGLLSQFPGVPEGVVDVIPVDLVVGAICSVAARGPANADGSPDITQVASGSANPLEFQRMVDLVSGWFTEHPIYDRDGQPISVPEFKFRGRGQVEGELNRAKKVLGTAEKVLAALPLRGKQAQWAAGIEEKRELVERASTYVTLYGAYTECEAIYGVDGLLALHAAHSPGDQVTFGCDPRVVDWDHYVREIHLPSVVKSARVRTEGGPSTSEDRTTRLRRQVLAPERQIAAFDLENTLIASNVVTSFAWLATRRLEASDRRTLAARLLAEGPALLRLDRRDRSDFLRHFYRRYEGAPAHELFTDSAEMLSELILTKSFPAGLRRVREHRALGHRTVLITGALDFVVAPLRPLFDDIVSTEMTVGADGTYTGQMTRVPPTGESRAQALYDYADLHGLDVAEAVAYADSTSDLPMLEAVGFPVAVNPEARLASLARKRGWLVEQWDKAPGFVPPRVPLSKPPGPRREPLRVPGYRSPDRAARRRVR
ncbi:HAD-IB family hydrolase [Iamia sp.]|uniref:HAD-IB family hydrolase n=1 Tax=Iamia sp. TaxID=2722710 RepID=UPI002C7624B4|nr:HAD-IB family hydrolase [Iamia sp.]HXH58658.1 HAD-IB family hydrolase [Iamia sp.]